ncbi:hypothetical protein CXF42_10355, partial [Corynebacterium bovis]
PGAAAVRVTSNPVVAVLLSAVFATVSAVGGLVASLAPGLPVSRFFWGGEGCVSCRRNKGL